MKRSELFPSTSHGNEDSNDMKCGICFEAFSLRGLMNGCKHVFCFVCIEKWSQTSNTCPLCKKRFSQLTKVDLLNPNKKGKRIPIENKNQRVAYDDDPAWLIDFEEHRNGVSSINWIFNLFGNIISMVQFEEEGLDIESDLFDSDSSEESEEEEEAEVEVEEVEEEEEDSIVDLTEHSNDFMDLTIPMSAEIVSSRGFSENRPHIPRRRGHRRSHIYHGTQSYRSIGNANNIDSEGDAISERNFHRPLQRNFQSNQNDIHYPSSHCFHRNNNGNHQSHSNSNNSSSTIRNSLNSSNSNRRRRRRRRNVESISVSRDGNSFENGPSSPPSPLPHRNQWRPRDFTRTEHSRTSIHPMEDDHDQQTSYRPTQHYRPHLYSEQHNNASIVGDDANGNVSTIDNINNNLNNNNNNNNNSNNNNSSSGSNNNHVRRSRRGNFVGQSTREARDSIASSTSTISSSLNENMIAHWAPRTGYFRTARNTEMPLQHDERHRYNTARSQHRNAYQQQQQQQQQRHHHHNNNNNDNNNNHHHYHRDYRNSDNSGVDSNSSSNNEGNRTLSRGSPFLRY